MINSILPANVDQTLQRTHVGKICQSYRRSITSKAYLQSDWSAIGCEVGLRGWTQCKQGIGSDTAHNNVSPSSVFSPKYCTWPGKVQLQLEAIKTKTGSRKPAGVLAVS